MSADYLYLIVVLLFMRKWSEISKDIKKSKKHLRVLNRDIKTLIKNRPKFTEGEWNATYEYYLDVIYEEEEIIFDCRQERSRLIRKKLRMH